MTDQNSKSVVGVVDHLTRINGGNPPCKKTVQKIVYLIEEAGENLGFEYSIHFYGPYSAELDYEVQNLSAKGIFTIKYTDHGHLLSSAKESTNVEMGITATHIIEAFGSESPSALELIATALFVQRETQTKDKNRIVAGVKKIKGSKYTEKHIESAIQDLQNHGYFIAQ
jgi:uncharacterized protein YwgA